MKSICPIIFLLSMALSTAFGQNPQQLKQDLETDMLGFTDKLAGFAYCPAGRREAFAKQVELIDKFSNGMSARHFNDLNRTSGRDLKASEYFSKIISQFQNKIVFEFSGISVDDCTISKDGRQYVMAYARKDVELPEGDKSSYDCCFVYDISAKPYKVDRIIQVERLEPSDRCVPVEQQRKQTASNNLASKKFKEYKSQADAALEVGNFTEAKDLYQSALFYKPNDTDAMLKYEESEEQLSYNSYFESAELLEAQGRYEEAVENYRKAAKYQPGDTAVSERIGFCQAKIKEESNASNFNYYRELGDLNFEKQYFESAQSHYKTALNYRPGDTYCESRSKECGRKIQLGQEKVVYAQLKKARNLVAREKVKAYAEAVEIYTELIPSGKLNGTDYFFLAQIMDGQLTPVKKRMNYDNRYCAILAREYCYKAAFEFENQAARDLWNYHFSGRARKKKG